MGFGSSFDPEFLPCFRTFSTLGLLPQVSVCFSFVREIFRGLVGHIVRTGPMSCGTAQVRLQALPVTFYQRHAPRVVSVRSFIMYTTSPHNLRAHEGGQNRAKKASLKSIIKLQFYLNLSRLYELSDYTTFIQPSTEKIRNSHT